MTGFDPYDPVDPLNQYNNDPLYPDPGPVPGDPMFQDELHQASDQVLRRAKEQAQFQLMDPIVQSDIQSELWQRQAMRTEPPSPQEVSTTVEQTSKQYELSEEKKAALTIHILSTTVIPLDIVDDYKYKCKYCTEEVRPTAEGPHHESDCRRHAPVLRYDTDQAHTKKCKHCDARPSIAGFHHTKDCPRGFPALPTWSVKRDDYNSKCKYCTSEVRPISEGPHHEESCERHVSVPLFHTDLAHKYYCTHCDARPFVTGPHHKKGCQRHKDEIAIPIGLLSE